MTNVIVKRDPKPTQTKGDWTVKVGRGRGGKNISSHQQKSAAIKRARREARKRADKGTGVTLWVQDKKGNPKKESEYEGGHEGSGGGLFGGWL